MAMIHVRILEVFPSHEPTLSRPAATLSPPCGERAGRGVPIWFVVPMHAKNERGLPMNLPPHPFRPMNLVAADARRLIPFRLKEVRASSRRLLRLYEERGQPIAIDSRN